MWLQIFDVEAKLVLISPSGCLIDIKVELQDVGLLFRKSGIAIQLSSTDNLHALARCSQEGHQRLRHLLGLVSHLNSLLVRG